MKKPYLTFAIVVTTLLLSGTQSTIVDLYNNLFGAIETAIDWGIIFIALAILTLMFLILRGKTRSVFRNWNKLLGGIALGFAAWGILAFSSPTDEFRRHIWFRHHWSARFSRCLKNIRTINNRNYFIPSESNRITNV